MTDWVAPDVVRPDGDERVGGEREFLDGFLDFHRATLLWKCSGLTAEQLGRRAVPTSNLTLQGLIRHMTDVEREWFLRGVDQQDPVPPIYYTEERWNDDFDVIDPAAAPAEYDRFVAELDVVRAATARHGLDDTFVRHNGRPCSLRWVYLHMIEEYARHNGHADLLREAIDGTTGE